MVCLNLLVIQVVGMKIQAVFLSLGTLLNSKALLKFTKFKFEHKVKKVSQAT